MELILNLIPNRQAICFVDQTMATYTDLYNIPDKRELCFVVHELVINAVEAMEHAKKGDDATIQIHVSQNKEQVKVTVTDQAGGIPQDQWTSILQFDLKEITYSDRGRGLFFVKNMVDHLWFEQLADEKFLVGISKNINL